ncbi:FkbM family methyltransferase [Helicobacter sp. 11S02596-1]|uniref:FkbM family methyltransferase n=1 Tax=Helicobacter sp. 11S02596-1 TaxID=1476194 RepID=UPI000BA73556|nr:FkbM family methyltransferase [Helicobacter sp. 11S02596-1]PAF45166.1 hypothetical protein BJI48_00955 [Helicobacter sp. 11S02596-1]
MNNIITDKKPKQTTLAFIKKFLQPSTKRYILGTNAYAKSIFDALKNQGLVIEAFVDDFTKETSFEGIKIITRHHLQSLCGGSVIVAATTNKTKSVIQTIKALNEKLDVLDYFSFQKHSALPLLEVQFPDETQDPIRKTFADFREDFKQHRQNYQDIFERFADERSKNEFSSIINFRLTQDMDFLQDFDFRMHEQYFEDFLPNPKVFFDIGGYQGETSLEFIKRTPDYEHIYIFEPSEKNINLAKEYLHAYKNIDFFAIGVGKEKQTLFYKNQTKQQDTSNHITHYAKEGTQALPIDSIDALIAESKISQKVLNGGGAMIKMDIEGAERDALLGMKQTITSYHPTLAICVYHRFDDFHKIPELILGIRDDYTIFFRHYSETLDESVMFFVPKPKHKGYQ